MRQTRRLHAICAVLLLPLLLSASAVAIGGDGTPDSGLFRIGYSSRLLFELSREDARTALNLWTRELALETRFAAGAKATIYEDLPGLVAAIRGKEVDLIALNILDYLKIRDHLALEPAMFGMKNHKISDEQILLVRRDSGIDQLGKLRNGKLMIMTGGREIASLWLDTLLASRGLPPTEQFFGNLKEPGKANQTILPVFFRQADACVVNRNAFLTAAEMNPQIGRELTVLETSPAFPIAITCFRPNLSSEMKEKVFSSHEKLQLSTAGRQILNLFRIDGIRRAEPGDLEAIEALLRKHTTLKGIARKN